MCGQDGVDGVRRYDPLYSIPPLLSVILRRVRMASSYGDPEGVSLGPGAILASPSELSASPSELSAPPRGGTHHPLAPAPVPAPARANSVRSSVNA